MTTKDRIVSKCFAVYVASYQASKASLKWDEELYQKWDRQVDKAIGELKEILKDE